ncbi:MAG: HEAT repeat domain-containing protein [Nitrospirota bacterium]
MEKETSIRTTGIPVIVKPELSEFVLSLIQAFLKTGYYMPDHPEAKKARTGLYENLKNILKGKSEICFIAVKEGGLSEIFIGGIFEEPVNAGSFMMKSMAEMFIPKFVEYFDRKNLSSFSMKATMSRQEFEKFIDIMTESPMNEDDNIDSPDSLTMKLVKNDILMVSTVFNVDIVGKGRKLPWRVEVSLSRLKRDLNMIPLYKDITEGKINEIRKMVFEDIIRPLKSPKLIEEMLANLDLISSDLKGFDPEEFESKIIEHVDEKSLLDVSRELIRVFSDVRSSFERLQDVELLVRLEYLKRITRKIFKKLSKHPIDDADLFSGLIKNKILAIQDIPAEIRNRVLKHLSLDGFLESPGKFFSEIAGLSDDIAIKEKIHLLYEFLPVLFREKRYIDILDIFILSRKKGIGYEVDKNPELTGNISREIYAGARTINKEESQELLNIISSLDNLGIYLLVSLLDNENRFVRRSAVEMLTLKGSGGIPFILEMFARKEGWYYTRNALIVLSNIGAGGNEVELLFKHNINHQEPNVRKEAVQGISVILGAKAESLLIPLLKDANVEVRKRAISSLSAIKSANPRVFNFFIDVLTNKIREEDVILEHIANTLANTPVPAEKKILLEDALIAILKESSIFKAVMDRNKYSNHLRACVINALGTIGTSKSLKILDRYSSSKDPLLCKAATESRQRLSKQVSSSG